MEKLKSRKLWMAVIAAVYFISQGDVNQAVFVIMTYLGIQGFIDSKK